MDSVETIILFCDKPLISTMICTILTWNYKYTSTWNTTQFNCNPLSKMVNLLKVSLCLMVITVFFFSPTSARRVNITYLDNCKDEDSKKAAVFVRDIDYHVLEDGSCDIVHCKVEITTLDPEPLNLLMTLFKCSQTDMGAPCQANPTNHEEMLNCDRLMNDDSGPWHMFTSAMEGGQCGDKIGVFGMSFARLRLEHLMKYLDVYDANYNTFRLKMNFMSTMTNQVRGCGELDFTLS